MSVYNDNFNEISGKVSKRKALEDAHDLNNEIAGRSTGRRSRFLPGNDPNLIRLKKEREERLLQALRDLMLTDAEYADFYAGAMNDLSAAENAVQDTLDELTAKLVKQRAILQEMRDRAPKVDGKAVFKDRHGNVWTEDGERVPDDIAATIEWRGNEYSYEELIARESHAEQLENSIHTLRGHQTELGGMRTQLEALEGQNSPENVETIQGIEDRIDEIESDVRKLQSAHMDRPSMSPQQTTETQNENTSLGIPKPTISAFD